MTRPRPTISRGTTNSPKNTTIVSSASLPFAISSTTNPGMYALSQSRFRHCADTLYVSYQFALRWRTEAEVLSGAGENTCGNTRCKQHENKDEAVQLSTLELPFAYEEHGERKSALVKVVLCPRCLRKLMWKRNKEKEAQQPPTQSEGPVEHRDHEGVVDEADDMRRLRRPNNGRESTTVETSSSTRRRSSRSRSPRHRKDNYHSRRRRSSPPQA